MRTTKIHEQVIAHLKQVYDPELPINIYDLGLIYNIHYSSKSKRVDVLMTLTTPTCPAAELIVENIEQEVLKIPAVQKVHVTITFDPPYDINRLSEDLKLILGI